MLTTHKTEVGTITLKEHYRDGEFIGAVVYVGGWKVNDYKTKKGAYKRFDAEVAKEKK